MERITQEQAYGLGLRLTQALSVAEDVSKEVAQQALGNTRLGEALLEVVKYGPDEALRRLRGEQSEVGSFLGLPANLGLLFEEQIAGFMAVKAWNEAKVSKNKYEEELRAAVQNFQYRKDLAAIGLTGPMIVDGRLRDQFLAEVTETYTYFDLEQATNYQGITTPSGIQVIQAQWGGKYRNKKTRWCRENFHPLEQGATIKEGLTGYLLFGRAWLAVCYKDLPGSVAEGGRVPCLDWSGGRAGLYGSFTDDARPGFGSASRGK
jgi:hypothetical protein